jgi:DNA-binding MarR family transcriptional regulator
VTSETTTGESLGEAFGAVARRLRTASMASLSAWDVTPSQMRAIRILTGHEDGVRSSELAHHLHIAPRSATEVVDTLEAKGLVQRSPDPTDRRATLVSLTPRGIELSSEVRRARGLESERLFERLSKTDRAQLARILHQLRSE